MSDETELARCYEEIDRLRAENDVLRRSAVSFGELAERLNHRLKAAQRLRFVGHLFPPTTGAGRRAGVCSGGHRRA